MQRIYIDLDLDPRRPRSALTGTAPAEIQAVLGSPVNVAIVFHRGGVVIAGDTSPTALHFLNGWQPGL